MALRDLFRARVSDAPRVEPRMASVMASGNTVELLTLNDPRLAEMLQGGASTNSGAVISKHTALNCAVAWRCSCIIRGVMTGIPRDLMLRESEAVRKPAVDHWFRRVLTETPNRWQTPGEFIGLMQLNLLLKGNAYGYLRRLGGEIREIIPLDPDRMEVRQADDLSISYVYTTRSGSQTTFKQSEILHLRGMSLDGVKGLSVIQHAKEAMGLSLQSEKTAAKLFKNGQFRSGAYKSPAALSDTAFERLQTQIKEGAGANSDEAGGSYIFEEGLEWQSTGAMSAKDMEFLGLRSFERTDVGMFFGVPPFLYGDTEKSTSWGTGIEQQNLGFLQYTIKNWITTWEEALKRDCLAGEDPRLYVHFDPKGFFEVDLAALREWIKVMLGNGQSPPVMTQNEVREKIDLQPRKEPWADELAKPPPKPAMDKTGQNPDDPAQPPGN